MAIFGRKFWSLRISPFKRSLYHLVSSLDDMSDTEESMMNVKLNFLPESEAPITLRDSLQPSQGKNFRTRRVHWILIIGGVCNMILLGVNLWGFDRGIFGHRHDGLNAALIKTSFYSPILQELDLGLHVDTINGSLFSLPRDNAASIYRDRPGPAVDAAWDQLSKVRWILIDRADVVRLGKDPSTAVRVPQSWNMGERYISEIDGQHQLHCLNELRMAAYSWYYHPDTEKRHPLYWTHISHCIDILRQNLVCQANVDLVTMNWVETQRNPYPDFSVKHVCRDHKALLVWQEENRALVDELPYFEKPNDAHELPMHEEYFQFDLHPKDRGSSTTDDLSYSHVHGMVIGK